MWPEPLKLSCIAAVILAGSWLVWLAVVSSPPAPLPIAPPPLNASAARPIWPPSTSEKSGQDLSAFVSVGTPPAVLVTEPCLGSWQYRVLRHLKHRRCPRYPPSQPGPFEAN